MKWISNIFWKYGYLTLIFIVTSNCTKKDAGDRDPSLSSDYNFLSAADISRFPEIESTQPSFLDRDSLPNNFLDILRYNGVNTIRLRLWVNPINNYSGFEEVSQFSDRLKKLGFKLWLSLHYSDTWADPGNQLTPAAWQGISFNVLKDSVKAYTKQVVENIQPEYIQIGNEINSGLLFPDGNLSTNPSQCKELLETAISAVRLYSQDSKIILHYAGIRGSDWFYNEMTSLDYDIIGLSFYPIWHGKDLDSLKTALKDLSENYNKEVVIAETAYPFSLAWKDWTNNIVGLEEQLILPEYPATPTGQQAFIGKISEIIKETPRGIGFCYWGGELIAWKGDQATDASPWENQALFNFNNKALPVLNEFSN